MNALFPPASITETYSSFPISSTIWVLSILGSEDTIFYRNKLEFTFSNKKWLTYEQVSSGATFENMNALGFHIPGMFDKVLDIEKCYLQNELCNEVRDAIKAYAYEKGLPFFDLRNHEGFLRTMVFRTSSIGEVMLILVFYHENREMREDLLNHLRNKFPQITSLLYVINGKCNDLSLGLPSS